MKKKIIGLIAIVAIAVVAGYNVYTSQNDVMLSDLVLNNIEALAFDGEGSGGTKFTVPYTEEISREDMGDYILVTYKSVVRCPHGGSESCTPSETTSQFRAPKG